MTDHDDDVMQVRCSECDFAAPDGNAFVDHVLLTGHTVDETMLADLRCDNNTLREFIRQVDHVLAHARRGEVPPDAEKIVFENDLPPDVRQKLLAFEVRELTDAALIDMLESMAAKLGNVPIAGAALLEAVRRLRERAPKKDEGPTTHENPTTAPAPAEGRLEDECQ